MEVVLEGEVSRVVALDLVAVVITSTVVHGITVAIVTILFDPLEALDSIKRQSSERLSTTSAKYERWQVEN